MAGKVHKHWIAVCQFDGLQQFTVGTITREEPWPHKTEDVLLLIRRKLAVVFPIPPRVMRLIPGRIEIITEAGDPIELQDSATG